MTYAVLTGQIEMPEDFFVHGDILLVDYFAPPAGDVSIREESKVHTPPRLNFRY